MQQSEVIQSEKSNSSHPQVRHRSQLSHTLLTLGLALGTLPAVTRADVSLEKSEGTTSHVDPDRQSKPTLNLDELAVEWGTPSTQPQVLNAGTRQPAAITQTQSNSPSLIQRLGRPLTAIRDYFSRLWDNNTVDLIGAGATLIAIAGSFFLGRRAFARKEFGEIVTVFITYPGEDEDSKPILIHEAILDGKLSDIWKESSRYGGIIRKAQKRCVPNFPYLGFDNSALFGSAGNELSEIFAADTLGAVAKRGGRPVPVSRLFSAMTYECIGGDESRTKVRIECFYRQDLRNLLTSPRDWAKAAHADGKSQRETFVRTFRNAALIAWRSFDDIKFPTDEGTNTRMRATALDLRRLFFMEDQKAAFEWLTEYVASHGNPGFRHEAFTNQDELAFAGLLMDKNGKKLHHVKEIYVASPKGNKPEVAAITK